MTNPAMMNPAAVAPETFVLPAWFPIHGLGILPMSSFLIRGRRPVLIDSGPAMLAGDLLRYLETLIDPADLAYLWLTHTDPDHTGAVQAVLRAAPHAKVVTTFLGMGKLSLREPLPPERVHLLNPGEVLDLGDRQLHAVRPPAYDAPETIGAFDSQTRTYFAADAFAALLDEPAGSAADLPPQRLRDGMAAWAAVDLPWLAVADQARFAQTLNNVWDLRPDHVLSSHLPPASGITRDLLSHLAAVAQGMAEPAGLQPERESLPV